MKRVYVDASDKRKLITIVPEWDKKARWASTIAYGKYKIKTHEAEYLAIIFGLEEIQGDLEIVSDNQGIVKVLNGLSRVTKETRPYFQKIRKLSENRLVRFTHGRKDFNEAGLKQEGYSLLEIRNPKLREMKRELKANTKRKTLRYMQRTKRKDSL